MVKRSRSMAFSLSDNTYHSLSQSSNLVDSVLGKIIPSYNPSTSSSGDIFSSSSHGLPMARMPKRSTQTRVGSTSLSHALSQAKVETNKGLKGKGRLASSQKKLNTVGFYLSSR